MLNDVNGHAISSQQDVFSGAAKFLSIYESYQSVTSIRLQIHNPYYGTGIRMTSSGKLIAKPGYSI